MIFIGWQTGYWILLLEMHLLDERKIALCSRILSNREKKVIGFSFYV